MNRNQDIDHLRLLSIFHYVVAGILALFSMLPVIHVALGIAMVTGAFDKFDNGSSPPAFFGWMFVVFPLIFIVCGLAMVICIAIGGRRLGRHSGYTYCLIIAGTECFFMSFGTVLGVFTIIVLMRPSVKGLFGVMETAHAP